MNVRQNVKVFAVLAIVFGFMSFSVLTDGTRQDALSAYNAGSKLANDNPQAAIDSLLLAIEIAEKLDTNGADILEKATGMLPGLYYNLGIAAYNADNYGEAIKELEEAVKVATKYNDEDMVKKANRSIYISYYKQGVTLYKEKQTEAGLASLNKSLEINPEYLMSLYYKGLCHKQLDQYDEMTTALDKAIEVGGTSAKNAKKVSAAKSAAASGLKASAKDLTKAGKHNEAVSTLEKAMTYLEDDADAEDKASYYFEIGNAYNAAGNTGKACEAYKKAAVGKYKVNAEYKINTELKCG